MLLPANIESTQCMSDIFISYSRKDQPKARMLADALAAKGWSVWWDPKIQSGKAFDRVIETAIAEAKCVVVVWSKHSVNSDWVRAEASNGLERGILIAVAIDENLALPLRFTQVHTENFSGWDGATDSQEFAKIVSDISALVAASGTGIKTNGNGLHYNKRVPVRLVWQCAAGLILSVCFFLFYRNATREEGGLGTAQHIIYLTLFCISVSVLLLGLLYVYAHRKGEQLSTRYKFAAPAGALLLTIACGFFLPHNPGETDLTIRILDKQKKAVTSGVVKLDLPGVPEQQITRSGEVKFKNIARELLRQNITISVVSPGYNEHVFDTLMNPARPLDIQLTEPSAIKLSGRIEDAGEMPIRDVELSVENTRFYTHTLTDGTYFLNIAAFANGDEIVLRTSHPGYEDKLVRLTVKSPETQVPDIVLKPVN